MSDRESWRSGIWINEYGQRVESEEEPEMDCPRHGLECEWEECTLASRYPREGTARIVECGACGNAFPEWNHESLSGWLCNGCDRTIIPRTQPVRFPETNDVETGEQADLSRGEWS